MAGSRSLELPADVAHAVLGMLSPTERPMAVLCVSRINVATRRVIGRLRAGSVTDEERALLQLTQADGGFWGTVALYCVLDLVHMALALGFVFRGEADRARWQAGEAFELYRDAVRALR